MQVPLLIGISIAVYFSLLLLIAWYTGRKSSQAGYFLGNRNSPWVVVALGMLSDSLSGVTFISVPGQVNVTAFHYMQVVFGYLAGYVVIAEVLLPVYYRMQLTSIYEYLGSRFGEVSRRTGAFFFILSRLLGAGARLFLAAGVIQIFLFDKLKIPFEISLALVILLILIYTYRGGIQTLVWTDLFQSVLLVSSVVITIYIVMKALNYSPAAAYEALVNDPRTQIFNWNFLEKSYFWKYFIGGAFVSIAMTGLDQNMMQKNLSCRSLGEAKKNIYLFTSLLSFVNLFFLSLGVLLYQYSEASGLPGALSAQNGLSPSDLLFPSLSLEHLGYAAAVIFMVGLTASTFSSADSVLTTLTTSAYYDLFKFDKKAASDVRKADYYRHATHIGFAIALFLVILIIRFFNNQAIISTILTIAGYTYGPLLGLFAFGIFTKRKAQDHYVPFVCLAAPAICYFISLNPFEILGDYKMSLEVLPLNGLLTFGGLRMISKSA